MDMQFDSFDRYAKAHLKNTAFRTVADSDNSHLFHLTLESLYQASLWTKKARNPKGEAFDLVAGFTDLYSPNAFADKFNEQHIIGMHVPLFVAINEFALFCFAQAGFFPELGDAKAEASPAPWDDRVPGIFLLDNTKNGERITNEHSRRLIPRDAERYHLASCLSFLMARFAWLHELAHGFNGHVDFVRDRGMALRLCELPDHIHAPPLELVKKRSAALRLNDTQVFQCLEFDADKSAFWGSVQIQLHQWENIESIIALPPLTRMKLTLFGCYAMPWLFEQFQSYMNTKDSASHPEPLLRLQSTFRVTKDRLLKDIPELTGLNAEVLAEFDRIRARIPSFHSACQLTQLFEQSTTAPELAVLNESQKQLEKELRAFEFITK